MSNENECRHSPIWSCCLSRSEAKQDIDLRGREEVSQVLHMTLVGVGLRSIVMKLDEHTNFNPPTHNRLIPPSVLSSSPVQTFMIT